MAKNTTAVAEAKNTAVSTDVIDFSADAGKGTEGVDKDSFAIPFLTVLQGLSPQLETVDGAKPGLFIDTITNELAESVTVIPVAFQRRFLRWLPRDQGGGYRGEMTVAEFEALNPPVNDKGIPIHNGEELKDTRNHFILVVRPDGSYYRALLSLGSTQIKKSKRWISRITGIDMVSNGKHFNPPSYSHMYTVKSVKEENEKGKWHGVLIDMEGPVQDKELYEAAKAFHDQIVSGLVEVTYPEGGVEGGAEGGDNEKF